MRTFLVRPIAAACLLLGAVPAFAWENFTIGLDPSGAKNVTINSDASIKDISVTPAGTAVGNKTNQLAGQFKINVAATNQANGGSLLNGTSFYTYCVELTEYMVSPSGSTNNYNVVATTNQVTAGKITKLNNLFTLATLDDANFLTSSYDVNKSTAFQAAVWEIVYETSGTYTLQGSVGPSNMITFNPGSTNQLAWAQGLLNNLGSVNSTYNLSVLSSQVSDPSHIGQDYLVMMPVPEPEGYALAIAGMAMVVALGRRRQHRA